MIKITCCETTICALITHWLISIYHTIEKIIKPVASQCPSDWSHSDYATTSSGCDNSFSELKFLEIIEATSEVYHVTVAAAADPYQRKTTERV